MALMKCAECGGQVSDKASNCPHCGCPVARAAAKCPECGGHVLPKASVCPHCGCPLQSADGPQSRRMNFTNSLGMEFVLITPGTFGGPRQDRATISRPFYLGKYPVTQGQWATVMGSNPSCFFESKGWVKKSTARNPVENVSWNDVQTFIHRLNITEGHTRYRLPTEAEWEYACRAGTTTDYFFGDNADNLGDYAWYYVNSGSVTHPVGEKLPNRWGLYDVHGNVWEWCSDWYDFTFKYSADSKSDPHGQPEGDCRVIRGGCWNSSPKGCQSGYRHYANSCDGSIGFRLVLSL